MGKRMKKKGFKKPEFNGKEPSKTVAEEPSTSAPEFKSETPSGRNDPEWYSKNPALLADAASYPFSYPVGEKTRLTNLALDGVTINSITYNVKPVVADYTPAGIICYKLAPSIGMSRDKSDPLNVASDALYAKVRFQNSGRKNYDPCDLMLYCLTFGQIYSYLVWMRRIYSEALIYSQRNRYVPRGMFLCENVDLDNLLANLANFRYFINAFTSKIASFAVPADLTYFKRMCFLYSGIYTEGNSIKDQLYMLAPAGFWHFDLDSSSLGYLKYVQLVGTGVDGKLTVQDLISYANNMLQNVTKDEDFGIMSGDILKAFGVEGIIKLGPLDATTTIAPMYEPLVLSQFKNAHMMVTDIDSAYSSVVGANKYDVTQDASGNLLSHMVVKDYNTPGAGAGIPAVIAHYVSRMRSVMSINNDSPTPAEVIESSRFMTSPGRIISGETFLACGTEIIDSIICASEHNILDTSSDVREVHSITSTNLPYGFEFMIHYGTSYPDAHCTDWRNYMRLITDLSNFNWAPRLMMIFADAGDTSDVWFDEILEIWPIDNFTIMDDVNVQKLQEAAILGLFHISGIAMS